MVDTALLSKNFLLSKVSDELNGHADVELTDMHVHQTVHDNDAPLSAVYFPIDAVISVVTIMEDGTSIEVGSIGREGTTGVFVALGATTAPGTTYCQVNGKSLRMGLPTFQRLLPNDRFRDMLHAYIVGYVKVLSQLVACNRLHELDQRCARWLLMTHDRVGKNEFPLTQEFLAMMLGVRRSGVTLAATAFQEAGFISYSRGSVKILDRGGLEAESCECYEIAKKAFQFPA